MQAAELELCRPMLLATFWDMIDAEKPIKSVT
jgi:hypothetical protein